LDSRNVRRSEEGEEEVEVEEEEGETSPAASCMVKKELTRRGGWKRGGGWWKAYCGLGLKLWKMVGKRKVRAGVEGVSWYDLSQSESRKQEGGREWMLT
jgi:hypothetical protein